MQEALGILETMGYIASYYALDAMLMAANVRFVGKEQIGGGHLIFIIAGEIGAVEIAMDAGVERVEELGGLIFNHIIRRPAPDVETLLPPAPEKRSE